MVVKTVSGSVASWPATGNVTTKPLPVKNLRLKTDEKTEEITLSWDSDIQSQQDSYKIIYTEPVLYSARTIISMVYVTEFRIKICLLQPMYTYSFWVHAVSNGIESMGRRVQYEATDLSLECDIEDDRENEYNKGNTAIPAKTNMTATRNRTESDSNLKQDVKMKEPTTKSSITTKPLSVATRKLATRSTTTTTTTSTQPSTTLSIKTTSTLAATTRKLTTISTTTTTTGMFRSHVRFVFLLCFRISI